MSSARKRAYGRASGPVLQSGFLVILAHSALHRRLHSFSPSFLITFCPFQASISFSPFHCILASASSFLLLYHRFLQSLMMFLPILPNAVPDSSDHSRSLFFFNFVFENMIRHPSEDVLRNNEKKNPIYVLGALTFFPFLIRLPLILGLVLLILLSRFMC